MDHSLCFLQLPKNFSQAKVPLVYITDQYLSTDGFKQKCAVTVLQMCQNNKLLLRFLLSLCACILCLFTIVQPNTKCLQNVQTTNEKKIIPIANLSQTYRNIACLFTHFLWDSYDFISQSFVYLTFYMLFKLFQLQKSFKY